MPAEGSGAAYRETSLVLTGPQRRILSTSLRFAEEQILACRRLVGEASGPQPELLVLYDGYATEQSDELAALLDALLETVYRLRDVFAIVPERRSIRRSFSAHLSTAWETLEDLRPGRLKAYGTVDPAVARILEELVEASTQSIRLALDRAHSA